MKAQIKSLIWDSIKVKEEVIKSNVDQIKKAINEITQALKKGNKIILFGNGCSAADCQHIAAELVGRFRKERNALAAIALTCNTSNLTALSNDYGYSVVFARQIEALGKRGDIALGISTSGKSKNVIEGLKTSKKIGMKTLALCGSYEKELAKVCDLVIAVPSINTARIQEAHILIAHIISELVEDSFSDE